MRKGVDTHKKGTSWHFNVVNNKKFSFYTVEPAWETTKSSIKRRFEITGIVDKELFNEIQYGKRH